MSLFDSFCLSHISLTLLSKASGRSALSRKAFHSLLAVSQGFQIVSQQCRSQPCSNKSYRNCLNSRSNTARQHTKSFEKKKQSSLPNLKLMARSDSATLRNHPASPRPATSQSHRKVGTVVFQARKKKRESIHFH